MSLPSSVNPDPFSIQAAPLCLSSSSSMHSNKRFNKRTRTTRALPRRFEQSKKIPSPSPHFARYHSPVAHLSIIHSTSPATSNLRFRTTFIQLTCNLTNHKPHSFCPRLRQSRKYLLIVGSSPTFFQSPSCPSSRPLHCLPIRHPVVFGEFICLVHRVDRPLSHHCFSKLRLGLPCFTVGCAIQPVDNCQTLPSDFFHLPVFWQQFSPFPPVPSLLLSLDIFLLLRNQQFHIVKHVSFEDLLFTLFFGHLLFFPPVPFLPNILTVMTPQVLPSCRVGKIRPHNTRTSISRSPCSDTNVRS